jgi:hypothetical protein
MHDVKSCCSASESELQMPVVPAMPKSTAMTVTTGVGSGNGNGSGSNGKRSNGSRSRSSGSEQSVQTGTGSGGGGGGGGGGGIQLQHSSSSISRISKIYLVVDSHFALRWAIPVNSLSMSCRRCWCCCRVALRSRAQCLRRFRFQRADDNLPLTQFEAMSIVD